MKTQNRIEVFQIGSIVYIHKDIEATISAVMISENCYITYKVIWWNGSVRHTEWLEQHEIKSHPNQSSFKIGFKNDKSN